MNFQGIWTSIAKEPCSFVIFQRGSPPPSIRACHPSAQMNNTTSDNVERKDLTVIPNTNKGIYSNTQTLGYLLSFMGDKYPTKIKER